jgi:hypothetical protein
LQRTRLRHTVNSFLILDPLNFTTDTVPPKKRILDTSQDFYTVGFVPGANVHFSYDLAKGMHNHNDWCQSPLTFLLIFQQSQFQHSSFIKLCLLKHLKETPPTENTCSHRLTLTPWKQPHAKMQENVAYIRLKVVGPFFEPCASGSYVHASLFLFVIK